MLAGRRYADRLSVGRKRHAADPARVRGQVVQRPGGLGVPQADRPVPTDRCGQAIVEAESDAEDGVLVSLQRREARSARDVPDAAGAALEAADRLISPRVPERDRAIESAAGDPIPVRTEGASDDLRRRSIEPV